MADDQRMTVRQHFQRTMDKYQSIVDATCDSTDKDHQERIKDCIKTMHEFWGHLQTSGALSSNDNLDDISTPTLAMLTTPYTIGDLHLRLVDKDIDRERLLTFAEKYFESFLRIIVDLELITEKEMEIGMKYNPANRTARIELSRAQSALKQQIKGFDDRIGFLRVRSIRMKHLVSHQDSDDEEDENGQLSDRAKAKNDYELPDEDDKYDEMLDGAEGSELEELLRERNIAQLKWCIGDCFQQCQTVSREAEMLKMLAPEKREQIAAEYQKNLELTEQRLNEAGRNTYVILPGGQVATGPGDGHTLLRQKFKDEAFINRIQPTMTLEEFAQSEMAWVQEQMEQQAAGEQAQKEEDERLGEEGIEERERQKQAAWDDWRDDNPPIGITAKGNYS